MEMLRAQLDTDAFGKLEGKYFSIFFKLSNITLSHKAVTFIQLEQFLKMRTFYPLSKTSTEVKSTHFWRISNLLINE